MVIVGLAARIIAVDESGKINRQKREPSIGDEREFS
jgi:hypothetical protein